MSVDHQPSDTSPADDGDAPRSTGVTLIRPHDQAVAQRTLVVLGVGRGGTSAVAGAFASLGVFLGDRLGEVNFEDRKLSGAIEAQDDGRSREVITDYNQRHDIWGWKRPSAFRYLEFIDANLRNPHYICVFRDAGAIASRREVSMGFAPVKSALGALRTYVKILTFVAQTERPALMISYEKMLMEPLPVVTELAAWARVSDASLIDRATDSIEASPYEYRLRSKRR